MKTFFISPDYQCNEKCVFCPCAQNARQYTPLTLNEMKESLDTAIEKAGIEMVLISGGEPTLRKETLAFVEYVRLKNVKLGILSNALKFASKAYLTKFINAAGTSFELTTAFHSCHPLQHDNITQLPNSFAKSLQGVQNLIEAGVKVTVKHNINKQTYRELPELADWVYRTFPDNVPWVLCNIDVCGIALHNQNQTAVSFSESRPYVEAALDKVITHSQQGRQRAVNLFNTPLCCIDPYYWSFLRKDEGGIMPALRLPYEKGDDNFLKLNVRGDGGAIFEPCRQCALQQQCPGTWSKTGELYATLLKAFHS